jgi:hypothetical protein
VLDLLMRQTGSIRGFRDRLRGQFPAAIELVPNIKPEVSYWLAHSFSFWEFCGAVRLMESGYTVKTQLHFVVTRLI